MTVYRGMTTLKISYKGCTIELVPVVERQIDVYINGFPRICRNTVAQCMREAKAIIDRGY